MGNFLYFHAQERNDDGVMFIIFFGGFSLLSIAYMLGTYFVMEYGPELREIRARNAAQKLPV